MRVHTVQYSLAIAFMLLCVCVCTAVQLNDLPLYRTYVCANSRSWRVSSCLKVETGKQRVKSPEGGNI